MVGSLRARFLSTARCLSRSRRALLYVPGSSQKMLEKSRQIKVDSLTFDLEDSVSPTQKVLARQFVAKHLQDLRCPQEKVVRINSRASGLAEADLAAISHVEYDAIMLPKVEGAVDIQWLADRIPAHIEIIVLIESAKAVVNIKEIASAHEQLSALVFAAEDYAANMNITRSTSLTEMTYARQAVVTTARAYNLASIDLVCTSFKDSALLVEECRSGAALGYTGKQAIHPSQVSAIQAAYSPSPEKISWARSLLAKAEREQKGAFEFQGKMIDAPVLLIAKNILELHKGTLEPVRGLLIGAPGAGKGTQAKRIMQKYADIIVLSSGDLLRDHMNRGTNLGVKAKETIAKGELIDDNTMCDLVISTITERGLMANSFFLDGFPRTVAQAKTLDRYLAELGNPLNFVLNLDVPYRVILDRIIDRWIHAPSGRTYNLSYNPPKIAGKDDITGEALTKRVDDDVETFRSRLKIYDDTTIPLLEYYKKGNVLKSFTGETSDIIWPQIDDALAARG